jgi:hypothetical protein
MPVILATQEAEIRRITVWANSSRDPISKKLITKNKNKTKKSLGKWFKV